MGWEARVRTTETRESARESECVCVCVGVRRTGTERDRGGRGCEGGGRRREEGIVELLATEHPRFPHPFQLAGRATYLIPRGAPGGGAHGPHGLGPPGVGGKRLRRHAGLLCRASSPHSHLSLDGAGSRLVPKNLEGRPAQDRICTCRDAIRQDDFFGKVQFRSEKSETIRGGEGATRLTGANQQLC